MKKIFSYDDLEQILRENPKIFILKHSLTCPVSAEAYHECEEFSNEHSFIPFVYLTVQESRPLSNEIMNKFNIQHESPQCLLVNDGSVTFHASHFSITKEALEKAWK